jgi:D-glycero-D-manno-heptose 1,7-bisphosphate phosphatase
MPKNKIKETEELVKIVQHLKRKNKKIVACSGSFDILHIGHINLLREAKALGDILIVLLNSDKSIRSYKGPARPINPQKNRAQVLASLETVDFITIFDEITPTKVLEKLKPDIYYQGSDWGRNCIEREVIEKNGGKIYVRKIPKEEPTTSQLVQKIIKAYSKPSGKAVFLDRDGTININEPEHLHKIEDFKFTLYAIRALKKLSKSDYKIIIVTNQSGIGRGYYTERDLKKLHQWMLKEFRKKRIRVDKIYYCPHRPEDKCSCRKPNIGMLLKAVKDFNISLNDSWLVGDDERDVIMGRRANVKTIKLGKKMSKQLKLKPNYYANNLLEAVRIILS